MNKPSLKRQNAVLSSPQNSQVFVPDEEDHICTNDQMLSYNELLDTVHSVCFLIRMCCFDCFGDYYNVEVISRNI